LVDTREQARLSFQEYFVKYGCQPTVTGFEFSNAAQSRPAPGVIEAIDRADCIIVCPSNPMVSIGPILAIPGIQTALRRKSCIVAVSPIIGGKAVKGPAAKMYSELGFIPSSLEVARQYSSWVKGILIDQVDDGLTPDILALGYQVKVANTLMQSLEDRAALARIVLELAGKMIKSGAS
jgi:LPPG:FO 2-phospho-L-lactate transferase